MSSTRPPVYVGSVSTFFFFLTTVILAILLLVNNSRSDKERGYDSSSVMNRITYMQELALVKHNYTGVISYKDYMKFLNFNVPLTDKYFLLKYNGYIKAGVDFSRIKISCAPMIQNISNPLSASSDFSRSGCFSMGAFSVQVSCIITKGRLFYSPFFHRANLLHIIDFSTK